MVTVEHGVMTRGNFGKKDRARQVGSEDGRFIKTVAAVVRYVDKLHRLNGEPLRLGTDKGQQSRDVEFEDAVRVQLVVILHITRAES